MAHAIFEWDAALAVPLVEYTRRMVAVADPSGESTPGLMADVAAYLPTQTAWAQLRTYSTHQWLSIEAITVPSLSAQAETEAGTVCCPAHALTPSRAPATALALGGRAGDQRPRGHVHRFIVCGPSYRECDLLRLSRLDEPLGLNRFRVMRKAIGVEYLIWQGKIWSVARSSEGWRAYDGGGMNNPAAITGATTTTCIGRPPTDVGGYI